MLLQSYDSTSTSDWKEKKYPLAIFFETNTYFGYAKTVLFQWILLQMNIQHIYGKVNYWELLVATKFHFSWDFLYYEIPCNAILKTRCSWNMYRITQRPAYIKNDFQSFRNVAGGQNGINALIFINAIRWNTDFYGLWRFVRWMFYSAPRKVIFLVYYKTVWSDKEHFSVWRPGRWLHVRIFGKWQTELTEETEFQIFSPSKGFVSYEHCSLLCQTSFNIM